MAAATIPFTSIEEYLHTAHDPDMDYVEGDLEDRNVGEMDHSDIQGEPISIFRTHADEWKLRAFTALRVQVSQERFRVPDLCVLPDGAQRTRIVLSAPLLCMEVLSPEDRFQRLLVKCQDYLRMGVPEVWIFDQVARVVHALRTGEFRTLQTGTIRLPGTSIEVSLARVFGVLDLS